MRHRIREFSSKLLWALGSTKPARAGRDRLTAVTFHRVLPEGHRREYPYPGLAVSPEELSWFLAFFRRHYEIDPLNTALARWTAGDAAGRPRMAITFDDG